MDPTKLFYECRTPVPHPKTPNEAFSTYQLRPTPGGELPTIHSPVDYIIACVRAMKGVPPEYTLTEVFVKIGPSQFAQVSTTIDAIKPRFHFNKFFVLFKTAGGHVYEGPVDIITPDESEAAKGLMELGQDVGGSQLLTQLSGAGGGAAGGAAGGAGGGSSVRRRKRTAYRRTRRSQRKTRRSLRR
jgi:hypothetical protein